jgi:hypothetical protein
MPEADLFMVSSDSIHKLKILTARSERHAGVIMSLFKFKVLAVAF